MGAARVGDWLPIEDDLDMALARQYIHAFVWIASVLKDFLVFFHPLVHFVPLESEMVLQTYDLGRRCSITPGRIFRGLFANLDRPIRGFAFNRAPALILARHEKISPDVCSGKIVSRQNFRLAHELDSFTVGDGLTAEHDSHMARAIAHVNPMAGIAMDRHTLLDDVALHGVLLGGSNRSITSFRSTASLRSSR